MQVKWFDFWTNSCLFIGESIRVGEAAGERAYTIGRTQEKALWDGRDPDGHASREYSQ